MGGPTVLPFNKQDVDLGVAICLWGVFSRSHCRAIKEAVICDVCCACINGFGNIYPLVDM